MAKTMKQAMLTGINGEWIIRNDVPIPEPGVGQVLIKVKVASLCKQTDLNTVKGLHPPHDHQSWGMLPHHMRLYRGWKEDPLKKYYNTKYLYTDTPFPTLMGHEMAGEVVAIGPMPEAVKGIDGHEGAGWLLNTGRRPLKVGDHVSGSGVFGGFGEYGIMMADMPGILPNDMPYEIGTFAENVMIVNDVLRQCIFPAARPTVYISGQGALGGLATKLAKYMGAGRIIVSDPVKSKRDLAIQRGAEYAIDPTVENVADVVLTMTEGKGADVVIEAAGEPDSIATIPYLIKLGGIWGQIGACCEPVTVDWSYIHFRGITVYSAMSYLTSGGGDLMTAEQEAVDLLASGAIDMRDQITHRFTIDQLPAIAKEADENPDMIKALCYFDDQIQYVK